MTANLGTALENLMKPYDPAAVPASVAARFESIVQQALVPALEAAGHELSRRGIQSVLDAMRDLGKLFLIFTLRPPALPEGQPWPRLSLSWNEEEEGIALDYSGWLPTPLQGVHEATVGWEVVPAAEVVPRIIWFIEYALDLRPA